MQKSEEETSDVNNHKTCRSANRVPVASSGPPRTPQSNPTVLPAHRGGGGSRRRTGVPGSQNQAGWTEYIGLGGVVSAQATVLFMVASQTCKPIGQQPPEIPAYLHDYAHKSVPRSCLRDTRGVSGSTVGRAASILTLNH